MTPEIEDAIWTACGVTTKPRKVWLFQIADHPRAVGTFQSESSSVREFTTKLRAFLRELEDGMTIQELLIELDSPSERSQC